MSTLSTTAQVLCPGLCGPVSCGEAVEANFGTFADTTFSVAPCSSLLAQGWEGSQLVDFKSRADRLVLVAEETVVRHRDGLVTFTA